MLFCKAHCNLVIHGDKMGIKCIIHADKSFLFFVQSGQHSLDVVLSA
jgi:hypothetical protein